MTAPVGLALSQCPGITATGDSSAALQAALNLKQPIVADCPVNMIMGSDPTKGIFAPPGTDITFVPGKGRFDTDAAGFPALCFMHADGIIRGLTMRYTGTLGGIGNPASSGNWTDGAAKNYLLKIGITPSFTGVGGTWWTGPSNTSALISIRGASNVTLQGGKMYVDDGVTPDRFAYCGVGIDAAFAPGLAATPTTPLAVPNVTVSDFEQDGVCMGFVGGGGNVSFTRMLRKRYADLEGPAGANVIGGSGTPIAPPHWLYLQGTLANPMRATLRDCLDLAVFAGTASVSPRYLHPLKLELVNGSSVDGFHSLCKHGGMGVLSNGATVGGTVRNSSFSIDTSLVDSLGQPLCPGGLFFPSNYSYPDLDIEVSIRNAASGWPVGGLWPGRPQGVLRLNASVDCGS